MTSENTGPSSVDIAGFDLKLTIASSDITFTDLTTATTLAPYIFGSDSAFGPDIATSVAANVILASDLDASGQISLASGATVGVGHLLFDVSASGAGSYTLSAAPAGTNFSDLNGSDVPIDQFGVGTITITGVPATPAGRRALLAAC